MRRAAPVTQNHLSKPKDLMLQNATALRKSAPWPPNISDEHVSCTAPATRHASLQILLKCPTPAIVFGNATKPSSRFAYFWQGAQSLAPATQNDIWTSKSAPNPGRTHQFLILLTWNWKCASHHNGVHFFDMSTFKSNPTLRCFVHFDIEITFAPQRRAFFPHGNFQLPQVVQEWCVLCILTLQCASRHNGVHFFDISTLKKVLWKWCVLCILTSQCASRQNGVQFFISHLARWLRTRCFSEHTFRTSGATNHWKKHSESRLFYLFAHLHLSSDSFSSLIVSLLLWLFPPLLFHL